MRIQGTKSLLDKIGVKNDELVSPEGYENFPQSFMAWHANFVTMDRRKAIVLMNNATRYPVVIYRPDKKDIKNIRTLISEAIVEALRMEGVNRDVIKAYMDTAGDVVFSKTANRSMVAKMNNAVREIEFMGAALDEETTVQRFISMVSGRPQKFGPEKWLYPIEKMVECLGKVGHSNESVTTEVLDVNLYQLKIDISLEGHDIWRRVLVPETFSFRHLHNVIQAVFDWQNYHLHEFTVARENKKPLQIIMDDFPETLDYFDFDTYEMGQERFIALKDVFSECDEVDYTYDFGDGWEHIVKLEKVVKGDVLKASYVAGAGERPPEDVGGAGGFEEYLRVMADVDDPDHQFTKTWGESQSERSIPPEKMNERLKGIVKGYTFSTYYL